MKLGGVVLLCVCALLPGVVSAQQFDQFDRETIDQWIRATFGQEPIDEERLNHPVWGTRFLLSLTDTERQGAFLFRQRCHVCHGEGMGNPRAYGPLLSKLNVQGREDFARTLIMEGSERMPGFRYGLQAAQIDLIIQYLKRVEKP